MLQGSRNRGAATPPPPPNNLFRGGNMVPVPLDGIQIRQVTQIQTICAIFNKQPNLKTIPHRRSQIIEDLFDSFSNHCLSWM